VASNFLSLIQESTPLGRIAMKRKIESGFALLAIAVLLLGGGGNAFAAINASPPASTVKLIFIHHSSGENWLVDDNGGLGTALRDNNYFVSDTNYGWGPDGIGDRTDIGHWYNWFVGPSSPTYLSALYGESDEHSSYTRLDSDPGGENQIVMFKSCFPNSQLGGNPDDPPTGSANPLRGQDAYSSDMTVANAKGIYNDILGYFALHQEKLFVAVTAPPLVSGATDEAHAANARAFNNWLVNDWLTGYPYHNVAVFDFYNVLTSNGGDRNTNDAGVETGNHHRMWEGLAQHIMTVANDMADYGSSAGDSHPTPAGNQKATQEFPTLLNAYYHCWTETGDCPTLAPQAHFTGVPRTGYAPLLVHFTDLSSGSITGWQWAFGDLSTSTEQHPTHLYATAGTYTVSLTITRPGGGTEVSTQVDYVTAIANPYGVAPAEGSIGTQITVTGTGFGDIKGRVYLRYQDARGRLRRKSLRVESWTDGLIVARVWAKMEPRLSDVMIQPKRQAPVIVQNVFTAMVPVVDSITPATGSPGDSIAVAGDYFGTAKGAVRFRYLSGGRLRSKRCKVTSWTMDPATGESSVTFTVPDRVAPGTYDVVVSNKIGATVVGGGFTIP
jgi:PKD repeat protein